MVLEQNQGIGVFYSYFFSMKKLKKLYMLDNIIFESLDSHPEFISKLRQRYWDEWSE